MISKQYIGMKIPGPTVEVERQMVRSFAKAIGEEDPIYYSKKAAQSAGFADCPAPPTFAFTLNMTSDNPLGYLDEMGVTIDRILHGEQSFEYRRPIVVGDVLKLEGRVCDIFTKKGGALSFIITETSCEDAAGETVVRMRGTTVILPRED